MEKISSRQKRVMQKLEYSLYFHKLVNEFGGKKPSYDELFQLRKRLKDATVADLSLFWNDLLEYKIMNPKINLSKNLIGGAHKSDTIDSNGEHINLIHVYPETSYRDVKRAFQKIQQAFPEKKKIQPLGDQSEEVYETIFKALQDGKKAAEIFDIFNDDESIEYSVERKTIDSVIKKMRTGT